MSPLPHPRPENPARDVAHRPLHNRSMGLVWWL